MRIVQLIDELGFGGAEKLVVGLATELARRGHVVQLICLREIGVDPVDLTVFKNVGGEILSLAKPPGLHLPTLKKLAKHLREFRADVVHTHNHLVHHYGAVAGRLAGVPVVLSTLHGSASLRTSAKWSQVLYWLSSMIGSGVISVCDEIRQILRDDLHLPSKKIHVIDNGVDLSNYLRIEPRAPRVSKVFGTMGRLEPVKDHRTLLHAFSLLRDKYKNVALRILGDGSLKEELQALAVQLGVAADVQFMGFSLDTPGFLKDIDVFVISSYSEGLPLSVLEAMGAGLPIVGTAVGEIPNIVQTAECGWCAPPRKPDALAQAMENAMCAQDLLALGAKARARARDYYSVERMSADYEALYRQILS